MATETVTPATAYVSNYRVPSKQFKKDAIKHFITVDGVPYYPMKNFQFDSRDLKRLKRKRMINLSEGADIELYY